MDRILYSALPNRYIRLWIDKNTYISVGMFGQLTIMLGLLCAIESTVQLLLPSYYHCSMIEVEGKAL